LVACTPATRRRANHATLGLALASIACDWGQTRAAASTGWTNLYEKNPIMGPMPTVRAVDLYMLGATALVVAIGQHLPEWFRASLYGGVFLVESSTIYDNAQTKMPHASTCGVGG
jgi:hypothetical protein